MFFASEKVSSFSPFQALHLHHPHPSNTAPKLAQSRSICRRHISANKEMPCLGVGASQNTAEASEKIPTLGTLEKYLKKINIPKSNGVTVILRSGQHLPVHEEVHEMIKL